jgi:hypothetical protein
MTRDAIPGLCQVFTALHRLLDRLIGSEESGGRRGNALMVLDGEGGDAERRRDGRYGGELADEWR